MKKIIALLLAVVMVLALVACAAKTEAPTAEAPKAEEKKEEAPKAEEKEEAPAAEEAPADGILSEEEAAAARDAGTLEGNPEAGYDFSPNTGNWYYSNYPNYKDFNADGVVKVAFVCKFSGAWFTPKANSLGETVKAAGYEYLFIDANSDEQAWIDGVQNIINQDFDAVVLTPVNTALLPDAVAMLQEAGIAYLTTDDPGPDADGFYCPHYGLDDYYLHNELGKLCAQAMVDRNFMDGVADDFSNFLLVFEDSPAVEAIHLRNVGFYEGLTETFEIPEDRIVWLDCGGSLSDECAEKFSSTLQANMGTVDKWVVSAGGAASVLPTITLFQEQGVDLKNVIMADCFSTADPLEMMMSDPAIADCCFGATLASAPSGVGMGEIIIDLVENGTPIPCFTGYAFLPCDASTVADLYAQLYG